MMLALSRQLPASLASQMQGHTWPQWELRGVSHLLNGQTALLLGFGAIALRLSALLAPFEMKLIGVRRQLGGDEPIAMIRMEQLDDYLPLADHVVNLLPSNASTAKLMEARRFGLMKPGARFYNIGRGTTVDQTALLDALNSGRLGAAYLDVTEPEPLPPEHPLWAAPNCYITPHTAGGDAREPWRLIEHFLANLKRFTGGRGIA
jgi:phosphoglycerate dehydrogenase-like enzyme